MKGTFEKGEPRVTAMTFSSHITFFLRTHIFSIKILALNLFNLVFWILVIAGVDIGAKRGSALIGLALGLAVGILFHGFCYVSYVLTHRNKGDERATKRRTR